MASSFAGRETNASPEPLFLPSQRRTPNRCGAEGACSSCPTMADDKPSSVGSLVSLIPRRRAEGMVAEIEALMRRAEAEGQGTLAYLLECALIEARHQTSNSVATAPSGMPTRLTSGDCGTSDV
jgi:hypothetical protein